MSDFFPFALRRLRRRGVILACTLALIAVPASAADDPVWPAITDPPTSKYSVGKWVWAELFTESRDKAVEFYRKVFDWSFQVVSTGRGPGYTVALSDGEPVGGMLEREHAYEQKRGSRWVGMISVADVKAAARYALEIPARSQVTLRLRLFAESEAPATPFGPGFDETLQHRQSAGLNSRANHSRRGAIDHDQ